MQLVIDILLLAIFAFLIFRGWLRGFFKSVLSLGRLILSVIITILFGSAFGGWLDETFVNPPVFDAVFKKLSELAADATASAEGGVQALVDKIPESFRGYLELDAVDPASEINALVEEWSHTVANGISGVISTVLGFILLFILSFILLTVAIFLVGKFAKLPFIKTADKLLGLAMGVISGVVAVVIISAVLGAILGVFGQGEIVENSFILRLFAGVKDLFFAAE